MTGFLRLIGAEVSKSYKLFFRYPVSAVAVVLIMSLIFAGLVTTAGGISAAGLVEGATIAQQYVLWSTMIIGFSSVSGAIRDDTRSGLLETVWMSPYPATAILLVRALTSVSITVIINLGLAGVLAAFLGLSSVLTPSLFAALAAVALAAVGVGQVVGGAMVVFKEIGPVTNLIQFLMLPLFLGVVDPEVWSWRALVPGYPSLGILDTASEATSIADHLALSFGNAMAWLTVGAVVMAIAVTRSKRRALIYQY